MAGRYTTRRQSEIDAQFLLETRRKYTTLEV